MNYYKILQIGKTATAKEIRQAYIKLVFDLHPDRAGKEKEQDFVNVQKAYKVLSNPLTKRDYDRGVFDENSSFSSTDSQQQQQSSSRQYTKKDYARYQERNAEQYYQYRSQRYRETGEGENDPIYGPHYFIVLGILFIASVSGGIFYYTFLQRHEKLKRDMEIMHDVAFGYEAEAKRKAQKVSSITLSDIPPNNSNSE